ncbi:MAG: pilin [bacterium]
MAKHKKIIFSFLIIWLSLFAIFFGFTVLAKSDPLEFTPQVTIPDPGGSPQFVEEVPIELDDSTKNICEYILAIYKYMIGVIGIFAAVALIIGGVIWITSAGSPGRIGMAKDWIAGSLIGLALALSAFLILATINVDLVLCRHLEIPAIQKKLTSPSSASAVVCSRVEYYESSQFSWNMRSGRAFCEAKMSATYAELLSEDFCTDDATKLWDDWSPLALNRLSVWLINAATQGLFRSIVGPFGWGQLLTSDTRIVQACCCTNTNKLPDGPICKANAGEDIDEYDGNICRINGQWGECKNGVCRPDLLPGDWANYPTGW